MTAVWVWTTLKIVLEKADEIKMKISFIIFCKLASSYVRNPYLKDCL